MRRTAIGSLEIVFTHLGLHTPDQRKTYVLWALGEGEASKGQGDKKHENPPYFYEVVENGKKSVRFIHC